MRPHGWQLPYHPLQVSAVAVFLALAFAFYVFFVPFVGVEIAECIIIAIHSPVVVSVFILYVLCAAIDPADPGVLRSKRYRSFKKKRKSEKSSPVDVIGDGDLSTLSSSVSGLQWKTKGGGISSGEIKDEDAEKGGLALISLVCTPCAAVCYKRCNKTRSIDLSSPETDFLFCSLCQVQISKHSKHCRVCDKCVDCFDHHCRWLNNCIGKKNYRGFIALLISGMAMFIMQWSVGVWVIVRCFLYRRSFEEAIISKLGSSFSLVPYLFVVGICTVLAMVATFPLLQLFFFHLLLIKKGLSTYDYIVAMREQDQQQGTDVMQSPLTSPASSTATGISGASSIGALHHRGSWCTPPRLFMDHEQPVLEPEIVRAITEENGKKKSVSVGINPWALARLRTDDVKRAAAEARSNSSVLQTLPRSMASVAETDSSSFDSSSRDCSSEMHPPSGFANKGLGSNIYCNISSSPQTDSSTVLSRSWQSGRRPFESTEFSARKPLDIAATAMPMPLQLEARSAFCATHNRPSSVTSSMSSPEAAACFARDPRRDPKLSVVRPSSSSIRSSTSDGYDASGGESTDDNDHLGGAGHALGKKLTMPSMPMPMHPTVEKATTTTTATPTLQGGRMQSSSDERRQPTSDSKKMRDRYSWSDPKRASLISQVRN